MIFFNLIIVAGIGPAAVGSAPNAAIFFCTYDTVKRISVKELGNPWIYYQTLLLRFSMNKVFENGFAITEGKQI